MNRTVLIIFAIVMISIPALAFAPDGGYQAGSVSISYYDNQPAFLSELTPLNVGEQRWAEFVSENGEWMGSKSERTGLVYRIWGGSSYVGIPADEGDAAGLAGEFLANHYELFGIRVADLKTASVYHPLGNWVIHFTQEYRGLDVYGAYATVAISRHGEVVLARSGYCPIGEVNVAPSISPDQAEWSAVSGLASVDYRFSEPELVIFPLPAEKGFDYRLAYRLEAISDLPSRWLVLVVAHSGEVLYRKDQILYDTVDGYVHGDIFEATPFDPPISMPFKWEGLTIAGPGLVYTDIDGYFSAEVGDQDPHAINADLSGFYVNVNNTGGSDASYSNLITPGETLMVDWDLSNSRDDERNGYFHTNVIHDYFKEIDPDFTLLDFPLPCNVNLNQTCNAYWDGSSINFFREGGGCENTGEIADVIYHEYGHGVTDFQYRPSSPSGAQHEGWSDYTAATITDQPLIGRGFYGEGTYLRTVDNDNRYPDDWSGEPHNDGLIIAGALWDLREALAPRTTYCDTLFHYARYYHSTNYEDYLIDILTVDDDDGDIYNGTPNSHEIYTAFDAHGIGPGDRLDIVHAPLEDTDNDTDPYAVVATITSTLTPVDEDAIFTNYWIDGGGSGSLQMTPTGNPAEYSAMIPAQPTGSLIGYYIEAADLDGNIYRDPADAPDHTHFFFVGLPDTLIFDDFEESSDWTVGVPDDDAVTGIWERVDPIGTYSDDDPTFPYQPEDDHTPDPGVNCWITGQQPLGDPDNGANDVDSGKTTLMSPVFDLEGLSNPVVQYYRWYTIRTNLDDSFFVDISNDGGAGWTNLETVTSTENYWQKKRFLVEQFIEPTSQTMLRYVAVDRPPGSLVEAGLDDFSILDLASTGIADDQGPGMPDRFALRQNYPNPFNANTEILFDLPRRCDVSITIYDIVGRVVRDFHLSGLQAGSGRVVWDGRANDGAEVAGGVYLYKLNAEEFSQTRKMLYLK